MELLRSILVLIATLGLLWVLTHIARLVWHEGWRMSLLLALLLLGVLVWLVTEALSALDAISLAGMVAAWVIVGCAAILILLRLSRWARDEVAPSALRDLKHWIA